MNDDMSDQLINDQAGLFRPGWIVKLLVYGVGRRTARGEGSLVVLLLAERARSEGARSTRAVEDPPAPIPRDITRKLGRINQMPKGR